MAPVALAGIGYEGRTLQGLVASLQRAEVTLVLDVRERPWSRKPGFSKSRLAASLAAAGIRYEHLPEAGNPSENRRTSASRVECLARYRLHLGSRPRVLKQIYDAAAGETTALLCLESAAEQCHRSVIFEEIAATIGPVEPRNL